MTAVDTNVLLDVLGGDRAASEMAHHALERCLAEGDLVVSTVVYAELANRFEAKAVLDRFLNGYLIAVSDLSVEGAYRAGRLFHAYRARGGKRDRVIADFLIAAHAFDGADRLLTSDAGFRGETFDSLQVIAPAEFA